MTIVKYIFISALLGLWGVYSGFVKPGKELAAGQAPVGAKYALLVGVNEYKPGSGITELTGAHNDVALMRSLLVEYGFKETLRSPPSRQAPCGDQVASSDIRTLCSQQATKQGILEAFRTQLIETSEAYWKGAAPEPAKGPTVVFYYSGHGSKLPDAPPLDEADGFDETLVPYDSDLAGTRDITDDEIDRLVTTLKHFTTNIIFFADSCHSGTIIRGGDGKKGFERSFQTSEGTRVEPLSDDNMSWDNSYVAISGSLPTEYSYEADLPDPVTQTNKRDGLLTYHFVNLLRQNPGATYREIMTLVRRAVTDSGRGQTPQYEGDVDRPVFGLAGSAVRRGIMVACQKTCSEPVVRRDAAGNDLGVHTIALAAGTIVGARRGGPIVVYAPGTKDLSGDAGKIASGNIISADAFASVAEVTFTDPRTADLPPLARAILVSPGFTDAKRVVAIDLSGSDAGSNDPGRTSMQKLASDLKSSPYLIPAEARSLLSSLNTKALAIRGPQDWDVAVVRATYADFSLGVVESKQGTHPLPSESGYFITNRSGMPLYNLWVSSGDPNAAEKVRDALEKHIRAENLRALSNESSDLNGKLKVDILRYKDIRSVSRGVCEITPFAAGELKDRAGNTPVLHPKDVFALRVTNTSRRDFLLYVLSIDARAKVNVIYPPRGAQERLAAGASLVTNAANPCYTFVIDPASAFGRETIKVIASDREVPVDLLRQDGIMPSTRSSSSALEMLLTQAAGNTRTVAPFAGSVSGWMGFNFDYEIVP